MHPPSSSDAAAFDDYDALAATLHLLARRLDRLLEEEGPARVQEMLRTVRSLTEDALESLEDVVDGMEVRRFHAARIDRDLRRLGREVTRESGGFVDVRCRGALDRLSVALSDALFSVAREVLVQLRSHARATITVVWLVVDRTEVTLEIRDDGVDLTKLHGQHRALGAGLGVPALSRLVASVGGRMEVGPSGIRGVRLRVTASVETQPTGTRGRAEVRGGVEARGKATALEP